MDRKDRTANFMMTAPAVSVVVPCFNEERYIEQCVESILASEYPRDRLEVIVVDGMSTDGTRAILKRMIVRYPNLRLVDNPDRIKPKALNLGIAAAEGDFLIRMDAHARYDCKYVARSVRYALEFQASNVGGIRKTLPGEDTLIARAIAQSISSSFAAGNATYRTGASEPKWVDTVFGGCYRMSLFDEIGYFDEDLIRGQDREFNIRLKRSGGNILLAPDIVCEYYSRGTLGAFVKWIYVAGLTPFYVSRIIGSAIFSWRNFVPMAFVLTIVALLVLTLLNTIFALALGLVLCVYILAALAAAFQISRAARDFRLMFAMPFVFAVTHVVYGVGSLVGLVKPVRRSTSRSTS